MVGRPDDYLEALEWVSDNAETVSSTIINILTSRLYPFSPAFLERIIGYCLDSANTTGVVEVETVNRGYDTSEVPRRISNGFPFHEMDTVETFLDQHTGGQVATYSPGHGFSAQRYEDMFELELNAALCEEAYRIVRQDPVGLLSEVGCHGPREELSAKEILDAVWGPLEDAIADALLDHGVMESIRQMRFRDVVREVRPDVLKTVARLEEAQAIVREYEAELAREVARRVRAHYLPVTDEVLYENLQLWIDPSVDDPVLVPSDANNEDDDATLDITKKNYATVSDLLSEVVLTNFGDPQNKLMRIEVRTMLETFMKSEIQELGSEILDTETKSIIRHAVPEEEKVDVPELVSAVMKIDIAGAVKAENVESDFIGYIGRLPFHETMSRIMPEVVIGPGSESENNGQQGPGF